jgi:hypothetical protein
MNDVILNWKKLKKFTKSEKTDNGISGKDRGYEHQKKRTAIISPKKKKKYYDKQGNKINDPDLLKEIMQGANVISYHEIKSGEDKRHIVRR